MGSFVRFAAVLGMTCAFVAAKAQAQAAEPAAPNERDQCVEQHERAQDARLNGKLLAARAALRQCSAAACPALISRDCVGWLAELEPLIPSVIFRASRDGEDVVNLRILESEQVLAESISGTSLELDPGPHHFTAELPGFPALESTYVLQAGDKGRVVRFDFVSPRPQPEAQASTSPPASAPARVPAAPAPRPVPTATYVLSGVSLAALVTGSVLGGLALSKHASVEARCAPLCREGDLKPIRQLAFGADISFVAALLAGAGATYTYATRPSVATSAAGTAFRLNVRGSF